MGRIPGKFLESGLRSSRAGRSWSSNPRGRRGAREARPAGKSRAHSAPGPTFNSCQVSPPPPPRLAGLGLPLKHEPPRPPLPALRGPRTLRARAPGATPHNPRCPQSGCRRGSGWGRRQVLVWGSRRLRPRRVAGEETRARPREPGGLGFRSLEPPVEESQRAAALPRSGRFCLLSLVPSRRREVSRIFSLLNRHPN